ncbi:peptidase inhibitor family I36 protein [Streptomyces sp. 3N207]|uniref:peptidase inhibitor family I36 protein n=1 Tax=Streptomyces sp. 3N207 TaxID=3457417 RepID=UPI003FD456C9
MKRTLAISASVLTLSTAGLVGLSPTAQAADSKARCGANQICLYEGYNFERGVYRHTHDSSSWPDVNLPSSINNKATSMVNNTEYTVTLAPDRGCRGDVLDKYEAKPKSRDGNLRENSGPNKGNFSNRVSCITFSR